METRRFTEGRGNAPGNKEAWAETVLPLSDVRDERCGIMNRNTVWWHNTDPGQHEKMNDKAVHDLRRMCNRPRPKKWLPTELHQPYDDLHIHEKYYFDHKKSMFNSH